METRRGPLPSTVLGLGVLVAAVILIMGVRELAWLITPAVFAIVVVTLVHPVYAGLVRRGVPAMAALIVLMVVIFGLIMILVATVGYAIGRWVAILPDYADTTAAAVANLAQWLTSLGIDSSMVRDAVGSVDLRALARWLAAQVPSALSLTAGLVLVYSLLLFIGIESSQIGPRAAALVEDHPRLARSLADYVANTRRYVAITGLFAVVVGVLDTILLLALDIPLALIWGLLAVVCNFIPYIGFVISLVPPALLALLGHDWETMLLVVVVYFLLNSLVTTIVPAKVVGNAVGLSMTVTIVSVAFWAWVLGPLGAVLAVPMSLLVKAVFIDHVPSARWLAGFVDAPPGRIRGHRDAHSDFPS